MNFIISFNFFVYFYQRWLVLDLRTTSTCSRLCRRLYRVFN